MQLQVLSAATVTYMPSEWSCKVTSMTTVPCCNCCQALMWSMLGLKEWCSKGLWDSCCDELAGHGMQAAVMQHDGNVMQSCSCSIYDNMVNIFHRSATPSHCSSRHRWHRWHRSVWKTQMTQICVIEKWSREAFLCSTAVLMQYLCSTA